MTRQKTSNAFVTHEKTFKQRNTKQELNVIRHVISKEFMK